MEFPAIPCRVFDAPAHALTAEFYAKTKLQMGDKIGWGKRGPALASQKLLYRFLWPANEF
jgi:hypothetical protein